jgi:anti-sigma factor (TIGR02949 family)
MNRVQFGESGCDKTRKYLDSYISNELLVETNHEVLRHLESCPACSAELDTCTRMRARLKAAVKSQPVPPELQARIREQIWSRRSGSWFTVGRVRWAVTVAASLLVCAGVWMNNSRDRMPDLSDRPAQSAYVQRVSSSLAAILRLGLGDHIHCSIFRRYPQAPPPVEKMETDLGPSYKGLLPVVRATIPEGYRLIMGHQCSYAGRKYIHLTFEKGGRLLSLVVARKDPGESLGGLPAAAEPSGIPIYQSAAGRYEVAGFEAGNFLAYVVSDLSGKTNLQIAANVAPGVREFLMKTPA